MINKDAEQDLAIINAIKKGDREAFAQLYDRHNAWLLAVAYRILQNHRDAEDLLHDVFLEIWRKAESYDAKRGTVQSWLAVKIRSRALDRIRALNTAKKHFISQQEAAVEPLDTSSDPATIVDHDMARHLMGSLSPAQRNVIELSYFQGFTCQEIANQCHLPLGTVKSGLLRAVQVLRREISNKEVPIYASR